MLFVGIMIGDLCRISFKQIVAAHGSVSFVLDFSHSLLCEVEGCGYLIERTLAIAIKSEFHNYDCLSSLVEGVNHLH